jgi:hypothetical protein
MKLTVEHTDGERATYTVLPKTIVAFERQFKTGLGAIATDSRMEYIYWLAWDSEKTAGKVVKPFDGWLDDVVSVESEDDAAPLVTEPSPAS